MILTNEKLNKTLLLQTAQQMNKYFKFFFIDSSFIQYVFTATMTDKDLSFSLRVSVRYVWFFHFILVLIVINGEKTNTQNER